SDNRSHFLYALDMPRMLSRLDSDQRRQLNEALDRKALYYLRKFVRNVADIRSDQRWAASCAPEIAELYNRALDRDDVQLAITPMTRDPATGRAYIPGSSIKGALRTAWVNHKLQTAPDRPRRPREFEPDLLGYRYRDEDGRNRFELRADPFRAVKVGDCLLPDNSNSIERVQIYKPDRKAGAPDPSGIHMFYDVTFSALDGEDIRATGRLIIDQRLAGRRGPDRGRWNFRNCVADAISAEQLLAACNEFYRPRLDDELKRFPHVHEHAGKLSEIAAALTENQALIRLGRFSHRECVTVPPRRDARPKHGSTRSLVSGDLPLGWVCIELREV
ncbi:MAG: type III-A CRISPR-associated RAMP protein Csm5, partial [Planctomycetota bacterium]